VSQCLCTATFDQFDVITAAIPPSPLSSFCLARSIASAQKAEDASGLHHFLARFTALTGHLYVFPPMRCLFVMATSHARHRYNALPGESPYLVRGNMCPQHAAANICFTPPFDAEMTPLF